uniref:Uncharacterized protein n=1 Tax=Cucumis melo TaxID=3656 RepID=A0A9I9EC99_CUCME
MGNSPSGIDNGTSNGNHPAQAVSDHMGGPCGCGLYQGTGDFLRKVHLSKYIENKTYILDKGDLFTTAMYDPHGICKSTEHIT